jgi:hypothetical protein
MTRFSKSATGKYIVHSKSYDMLIGTRAQVWHGTAFKTSGGLTKSNLLQNKHGRIVSRAKHSTAKKDNRLVKSGYGTKKGTFGFVKLNKSKSKRGGAAGPFGNASPPSAPNTTSNGSSHNNSNSHNSTNTNNKMDTSSGPKLPNGPPMNKTGGRRHRGKHSRKMRGGMYALTPHSYNGKGVGTSGVNLQFVAGNSG